MKSTIGGARAAAAVAAVAAVAALLVCGCGDDGVELADLPAAQASAQCDRLVRCGEYVNHDACVRERLALIDLAQVIADVDRGTTTYDPDAASACVEALASASCDRTSRDQVVALFACGTITHGHVPVGGACSAGDQCESGACDRAAGCALACCAGTCAAWSVTPAAIGESCAAASCAEGAYCDAGTCAPRIEEGQPCVAGACTYGTSCSGPGAPTCVKTPGIGDPCLPDGDYGGCPGVGLICDPTHRCVRRRQQGQACDPDGQPCVQDFPCKPSVYVCATLPTLGDLCRSRCAGDAYCKIPQFAINGVCVRHRRVGEPCVYDGECASRTCDATSQLCIDPIVCD